MRLELVWKSTKIYRWSHYVGEKKMQCRVALFMCCLLDSKIWQRDIGRADGDPSSLTAGPIATLNYNKANCADVGTILGLRYTYHHPSQNWYFLLVVSSPTSPTKNPQQFTAYGCDTCVSCTWSPLTAGVRVARGSRSSSILPPLSHLQRQSFIYSLLRSSNATNETPSQHMSPSRLLYQLPWISHNYFHPPYSRGLTSSTQLRESF